MATDMIVGKVSGGGDRFVSRPRDRGARVSTEGAGASDDRGFDVGIRERHRGSEVVAYGRASADLESSDASEDGSSWMHGFETGDMVWGKVKSHPWWPGHIFHESFASPSVRRSKREGHVLVAFFGDSSYGWFEPGELLPFDPHFEEKSKQTTSRNFLKAVEEAVDEVSRRRALGFSCLCRSPQNFRPASTPGFYAVDVIGYESGLVFSARQIKRARDNFVPVDVVSFLSKLAMAPDEAAHGSLEMTKMMSTVLSIRMATFEEFDETYAQAFGVEPVRPPRNELGVVELPTNVAPRAAPLSGPLVFAEALGKKKGTSVKSAARDQAKKNRYLFKRRDDAPPATPDASPPPSAVEVVVAHGSAPLPSSASAAASAAPAAVHHVPSDSGYVLQKRQSLPDDSCVQTVGSSDAGVQISQRWRDADADEEKKPDTLPQPSAPDLEVVGGPASGSVDTKPQEQEERKPPLSPPMPGCVVPEASEPITPDSKTPVDDQTPPPASPSPTTADAVSDVRPRKPFQDATVSGFVVDEVKKKKKKRPLPQQEDTDTREIQLKTTRKKKQRFGDIQAGPPDQEARATVGDSTQEARKSPEVAPQWEGKNLETVADADSMAAAVSSYPAVGFPKLDLNLQDLDFKELVPELSALALDPFYGSERNLSVLVRHVFLLFRSLVYQKSLPLRPSDEKPKSASQHDFQTSRPDSAATAPPPAQQRTAIPASAAAASAEEREQKPKLPGRPPKPTSDASVAKQDDPAKAGRKRPMSDRQEERSAKKERKLNQLKALASQKKAALKGRDFKPPKDEVKETGALSAPAGAAPKKGVVDSPSSAKKMQDAATPGALATTQTPPLLPQPQPAKVPSPTLLIMKFPPRSTLPSIASLKARFGRFGPLDVSGCRVFWKTYTCKVLFKFRADAQVALGHVTNNDIFGQIKVTYILKELEAAATAAAADAPEPEKRGPAATEAASTIAVQFRPGRSGDSPPLPPSALKKTHVQSQHPVQLKSILKKPSMDDSAPVNGAKETPRVKFMIDVEASNNSRRESPSGNYGAGGGNGSGVNGTSVAGPDVESFNSKISRLLAPAQTPSLPPLVPVPRTSEAHRPPSLPLPQNVTLPHVVTQDRGPPSFGKRQPAYQQQRLLNSVGPGAYNVDISGEMLGLLMRCKDIVASVQSALGYAAYRPL